MVFDWKSYDIFLSKYLVIFRLSHKINVILVDFSQEIVWPEATKKWPHWLQWRAELSGMSHWWGLSVPPSGWLSMFQSARPRVIWFCTLPCKCDANLTNRCWVPEYRKAWSISIVKSNTVNLKFHLIKIFSQLLSPHS